VLVEVILTAKIEAGAIESINFLHAEIQVDQSFLFCIDERVLRREPVWSKYWSEASISSIENLIALITVPVPHRRPG
jgi:hypothetical protein